MLINYDVIITGMLFQRFKKCFILQVRIFALMNDTILDAICERLRQKIYIKESNILSRGCLIEKMVFIVRGTMESVEENGIRNPLSEGDVCGEELLNWCLEHSSVNRGIILIPNFKHLLWCIFLIKIFQIGHAGLRIELF